MNVEDLNSAKLVDPDVLSAETTSPVRFPFTEAQREIWVAAQMGPEASCAYNVCHAFRLRGEFSLGAMKAALQQLVDRHQALRLACDPDGETQRVLDPVTIPLTTVDLSSLPAHLRGRERAVCLDRETNVPFDLEQGPLCRALILREDSRSYLIVFTVHHIVCDGWSSAILLGDLRELYGRQATGDDHPISPAYPFQAYAESLNEPEQVQLRFEAEEYWKAQFLGAVPPLELPLDALRKPVKSYSAERQQREIPDALYRHISRLASENECSPYIVLFAALEVLIYRLSSQSEFVLGAVVAAQAGSANANEMVGHGTNLLPIRATVDPKVTFAEHLQLVFERVLDAFDHQSLSLGSLIRSLNLPRDPSRNPLVTISFNFEQVTEPFRFNRLETELLPSPKRFATFDLEFHVLRTSDRAFAECVHNSDILRPETARRWLDHFETLLYSITQNSTEKISKLRLLTHKEEQELLAAPEEAGDIHHCIQQRFERQAELTPNAIAVCCQGSTLTYAELNRRANGLANRLISLGTKADDLVALCVERGIGMLVGLLGILKAGAAYLPLDLKYPAERVSFMLQDADVNLLVSERSLAGRLPQQECIVFFLDDLTVSEDETTLDQGHPQNLAYVIYTSGSTGKPKGVEVPHRAVVNMLNSFHVLLQMDAGDVLLATTTLSFDIAALELFGPITSGGTVIIATQIEAEDPVVLASLLDRSKPTIYQATPGRYQLLLDAGWKPRPQLQLVCGGEKMSRELADLLLEGSKALWNVYGPTETTVWSSAAKIERDGRPISIGTAIANTTLYILDGHLQPAPIGVHGELFIGGEGVARGYRNRPELTGERFLLNPFGGGRIYRTGDRARWLPDGRIELLGRNDEQVKIRGFRIELGEVEHALRSAQGVRESAVTVHANGTDTALVAYVVPNPGIHLTAADLRASLLKTLPDYMAPDGFVLLEKLPVTSNGKLDRRALPPPGTAITRKPQDSQPPRTEIETRLAVLWQSLLQVPRIGVHESFFDLGGHSVLATKLMTQLRSTFGVPLGLHEIFRTPTIAGLAESIQRTLWTQGYENIPNGVLSNSEIEIEI